jgi:flavin-dependent dehydrogenase
VLLVGDAAGYIDALTGEGIALSLRAAQAAVACIVAGRPDDYDAQWLRLSRTYRAITTSLLWVGRRRRLRPVIVPAAERLPGVFAHAVHVLGC